MESSLTLSLPQVNPDTGLAGVIVKPITEGQEVTVVAENNEPTSFWDFLDDAGTTLLNGFNTALDVVAQRELAELTQGAEVQRTTVGDPNDQPGNLKLSKADNFVNTYKTELIIGGVVLGVVGLFFAIRK